MNQTINLERGKRRVSKERKQKVELNNRSLVFKETIKVDKQKEIVELKYFINLWFS